MEDGGDQMVYMGKNNVNKQKEDQNYHNPYAEQPNEPISK